VFLLYPFYWPLYKAGGPVQSLYNLAALFQDELDVYFISLDKDIDGTPADHPLVLGKWNKGKNQENIFCTSAITPVLISRLLKQVKPDLLMINGMFHWHTTLFGIICGKINNYKIVVSPRGMLQEWGLQRGKLKKNFFLKVVKVLLGKRTVWHATDEQEKQDINKIFGRQQQVFVASNIPRSLSPYSTIRYPNHDGRIKLVFLSLINPNKNLHLIIDSMKRSNQRFTLDIYGPIIDEVYWGDCQRLMDGYANVTYMGAVPPWQVPQLIQRYQFFVLPTQGENFGHAIFDALASSVPVIISTHTPWKNIESSKAGWYVDIGSKDSLNQIFDRLSALKEPEYGEYRMSAHRYAKNYLDSMNYQADYKFLLSDLSPTGS
jgi:glycosyltransferase involved in cell wall biosynthesis